MEIERDERELPFIADPKGLAWRDSSSQVLKCDCEEGSCVMGVGLAGGSPSSDVSR